MDFTWNIMKTSARQRLRERRRSSSIERPNMCDLRIVLLGKNVEENSRVGNAILGRPAFENKSPPADVKQCCERVRGKLEDRHITVINSPHLLHPELSHYQITEAVKECVLLSAPGPHVLIIILQHESFNEGNMKRVKTVQNIFSDQAVQHSIVVTTDKETSDSKHNLMHELIKYCGERHVQFDLTNQWQSKIFKRIETVCKENSEEFLTCDIFEEAEERRSVEYEKSRKTDDDLDHKQEDEIRDGHKKKKKGNVLSKLKNKWTGKEQTQPTALQNMPKLNLVLCGNDENVKKSISNFILRERRSTHSSLCRVQEGEVCGRLINLVVLPALFNTHLTEEEVTQETLHCVSLCDPGVHAFLIGIPEGPLTDNNKGEIEKIQILFDTTEHVILLFTSDYTSKAPVTKSSTDCPRLTGQFNSRVVGLNKYGKSEQIPELLDYIQTTMPEPYLLQMYVKAQKKAVRHETEEKHKEELNRMRSKMKELERKTLSDGEDALLDSSCLRIVLIGKTGNGKSETGNTILGREEFYTEASPDSVTTVCMKGVCEIEGKSVAVVDTPGLFDTTLSNEQVQEEIVKCISLSAPGPHVFIIVLSVGRFTKEEKDTVDMIKMIFGVKAAQFSIVLFTRGDDLKNQTIEEYVEKSKNADLKKLIRDCGNRFLVFNNREKVNNTQVSQLLNMIEDVKKSSQGQYFTNTMFQDAEMSIKKKVEEILKEKDREIHIQKGELKAQYDRDIDSMAKRLEEEKKRADEERLQMEIKFREKEDKLRKEFEEKEKSEQKKREIDEEKRLDEEKQKKDDYHKEIEHMKREIENQRSQYEKEKKQREEEDKKREEKYKDNQKRFESEQKQAMEELKRKQKEEIEERNLEKIKMVKEEEDGRQRWERKIKEAENDKKEIQEEIKRQQKEWEMEKKSQMKEQEEKERKRKEQHNEQLKEKQEECDKLRKKFEREREEERQRWRDAEEKQREQKEREYEGKENEMKRHYEQLERVRKEEWQRRKQVEDERREEERKKWQKMMEDIKEEKEEEIRKREKKEKARREIEEKERDKMMQEHDEELNKIKRKHENEARKHAEEFNEFRDKKEQYIQELTSKLEERQKEYDLLEKLYQHFKKEKSTETKELEEQIEQLKKEKKCAIL